MRNARKKIIRKGCYYHCSNRAAGTTSDLPFTDIDKEQGFTLLEELSRCYLVQPVSICWMGNHFHFILFAPGKAPTLRTAAKRHNGFYGKQKKNLDPLLDSDKCAEVAAQMVDVSHFMSLFQQRFSCYINQTHKRRGMLWAGRFRSTILEGSYEALWNAVKYVEFNPVRAGIVDDPSDYRFSTWGRYCESGMHPLHKNFCKHMRTVAREHFGSTLSNEQVYVEFKNELARVPVWEAEQDKACKLLNDPQAKAEVALKGTPMKSDSMPIRFLRRTRHWTDGAIIGSKAFVQEVGCMFEDKENHAKLLKKRLSQGVTPEGGVLHCFKQLRTNLN